MKSVLLSTLLIAGSAFSSLLAATYTYDLDGDEAIITGFTGSGSITVPVSIDDYTIVGIDRLAFADNTAITSISFASGSSLEFIGPQAFSGCTALESVTLPSGLTQIQTGAFLDCSALQSVSLPSSLDTIQSGAFAACSSLSSISLPDAVSTLGDAAFMDCDALASVTLPSGLETLSNQAFSGCDALASISFSSSLATIESYAFADCESLTDVALPTSLVSLGEKAFSGSGSLVSISIGANLTSLETDAFDDCPSLSSFTVSSSNSAFSSSEGVLFDKAQTTIVRAPEGLSGSYTIPSSVTALSAGAFAHCESLTGITIPETITSIEEGVFYYATGLSELTLPESLTTIGQWAFGGCSGLIDVTLPSGISEISNDAFHYSSSLSWALFEGDSPTMGSAVFDNTADDFVIYFYSAQSGFTEPEWSGYASISLDGEANGYFAWLSKYGLDTDQDMSADLNGDGVSLLLAYALGLDPTENLTGAMPVPVVANGSISLTYYSRGSGLTYTVETSDDLVNWSDSDVEITSSDTVGVVTASADTSSGVSFIRLRIETE